uniref:Secreted protein n=1 Tax=Loa loa TaxID=7209 RepID=A0A1I7VJI5_LOALO
MKIVAAMTVIVIHALFHIDLSMKRKHIALAKCVVVSQKRKQQGGLSGDEVNKRTDEKITN